MDLRLTNDEAEVRALVAQGFCPVECSIGGASIVDDLMMDHHGDLSYLEGVAVRAYRDHYGARRDDPRFVVVGTADADATFAIASLAGLLPHPDADVAGVPKHLVAARQRDLSALAWLVNRIDTDPVGYNIAAHPDGATLLAFRALNLDATDDLGLYGAVRLWRTLTTGNPAALKPILQGAHESEAARLETAREDLRDSLLIYPVPYTSMRLAGIIESRVWGFDVWYGRMGGENDPEDVSSWLYPVVMAFANGEITVGCPNAAVAEKVFGEGGLKRIFPLLSPSGWGGREAVGGSPRGMKMTGKQFDDAMALVASKMRW